MIKLREIIYKAAHDYNARFLEHTPVIRKNYLRKLIVVGLVNGFSFGLLNAQDTAWMNLNDSLFNTQSSGSVTATFKATQIINAPTVEAPGKGGLQFLIMHRFGRINEGAYALFGLDNATIRFGLDYGLTNTLAVGIGRSSLDKTYDASVKWKVLQQQQKGMPLTVSLYALIANSTLRYTDKPFLNARLRTLYATQLLLARKFSPKVSLQLSPTWLHLNLVPSRRDKNDVFAVTAGGRFKISKRTSFNAEYTFLPDGQVVSNTVHPSLSFGFDIETGGHVFQLVFTNSQGMIAPYYIAKTGGSWGDGAIFFGFNISRAFTLKKKR